MHKIIGFLLATGAAVALAGGAQASVIHSAQAAPILFPQLEYQGTGPITFGAGGSVTWTSTNASNQGGAVFGWTQGYGFGANGFDTLNLTATNDSYDYYGAQDSMTFAFATPVQSVGGDINWYGDSVPVTMAVYDSSDTLIESLTLGDNYVNYVTPNQFYGFAESSATIKYFTLTNGYVGVVGGGLNLDGVNAPSGGVPEPASWALMLIGSAFVGGALRRRTVGLSPT